MMEKVLDKRCFLWYILSSSILCEIKTMATAKYLPLTIIVIGIFFISGCTAGPNTLLNTPTVGQISVAGFWWGLWHGMIAPFTFLISLFNSTVKIYEVHNSGGWYDFGFVLGSGILFGGGSKASS
jgi:hypothetical protein